MSAMIKAENIMMHYAETDVLKGINFFASTGEIHALTGRNASGKTTLGLILSGALSPTGGSVSFENTAISDRRTAENLGIFMVEQNPKLFPDLEIYESIIYGHEKKLFGNSVFMPGRAKMIEFSRNIMRKAGLDIEPCIKIRRLSEGELQLVNIARVLACNPVVLILDEFSASLTWFETQNIFAILRQMRADGKCIILISHNLDDIQTNCDRVSIFDTNGNLSEYTIDEAGRLPLAELMFGNNRTLKYPYLPVEKGKIVLSVKNINAGILKNVSFKLYQGELLGIAGLVGSGRTTLVNAIFNRSGNTGSFIEMFDVDQGTYTKRMGTVPENCDEAMFKFSSIGENVIISNLRKIAKGLLLSDVSEKIYARDIVDRMGIIPRDISLYPHLLSGGNKQKVIIARLLFSNSNVILFDEPTKNIDAAGKVDFYNILNQMRKKGAAIILISSDFLELIGMCSRILVLRKGRQIRELDPCNTTLEELYALTNKNGED
ncbi:MAG: sugar ABC transporter ATP-binding protein [Spirochaetaceae bacterium]|jgi:ABC-type sugar transport system ATPase subunit|nr:sugar ABC transporter ATP-binding protein [Spirochaetaceae bacterium]